MSTRTGALLTEPSLRSRHFNTLRIDHERGVVTKTSAIKEKLREEAHWYRALPEAFHALIPRLLHYEESDQRATLTLEYFAMPTLAELYTEGCLNEDTWVDILRALLDVQGRFAVFSSEVTPDQLRTMYVEKTLARLAEVQHQAAAWSSCLQATTLHYNGEELMGLSLLMPAIRERVEALTVSIPGCILHGDYCFSNILYDVETGQIRLIDPRGSFGAKGIYGDGRYDLAKLRHSVSGLYDFILADRFWVAREEAQFTGHIFAPATTDFVTAAFDQLLEERGVDVAEVCFLEGLLFLSMLPLHSEAPARQQMMYLTGLHLVNRTLAFPTRLALPVRKAA